jgi:hypothetical protein
MSLFHKTHSDALLLLRLPLLSYNRLSKMGRLIPLMVRQRLRDQILVQGERLTDFITSFDTTVVA